MGARNTQSPMLVTAAGLECQTIHTLSTCTFWLVSRWFPRALLVVVRVLCRTSCKSLGVWKLRATRCSLERKPREVASDCKVLRKREDGQEGRAQSTLRHERAAASTSVSAGRSVFWHCEAERLPKCTEKASGSSDSLLVRRTNGFTTER